MSNKPNLRITRTNPRRNTRGGGFVSRYPSRTKQGHMDGARIGLPIVRASG